MFFLLQRELAVLIAMNLTISDLPQSLDRLFFLLFPVWFAKPLVIRIIRNEFLSLS